MSRVAGKVVLVTGAGSGIGRATATLLAKEGAMVIVTDVNKPGGLETVQQIGGKARFVEQDTSREADWKRVIDDILAREGKLNGLVNNAGISGPFPATFETETVEQWQKILAVNVQGVFLGCKYGVPAMRQSGGGSIVNTSSASGVVATPGLPHYTAAKHGVLGLTKTVGLETARAGITCNAICPGYVWTPLVEKQIDDTAKARGISRDEVINDVLLAAQPSKRFATVEGLGELALFLSSPAAASITGTAISMDGGWTAQ